jgi:hypothetical protein
LSAGWRCRPGWVPTSDSSRRACAASCACHCCRDLHPTWAEPQGPSWPVAEMTHSPQVGSRKQNTTHTGKRAPFMLGLWTITSPSPLLRLKWSKMLFRHQSRPRTPPFRWRP